MNVQIPRELGGVGGEALFVDTCGDFYVQRVEEMAKCFSIRMKKLLESSKLGEKKLKKEFEMEAIVSKVHYLRVGDDSEQTNFQQMLPAFLKQRPE